MKLSLIALLVILSGRNISSAKLEPKEIETELSQQRSARVHRVSKFEIPEDDVSRTAKFLKDAMSKQAALWTSQNFAEFLKDFPNLHALVQQEAQLVLELNVILGELVQDGTASLKNIDLTISEMTNTDTSSTSIEPPSTNDDASRKLSSSLQNLDVYLQDSQDKDDRSDSRLPTSRIESMNESQLKVEKDIARSLDNVMKKIQDHISFVRSVFDKLCRKHHSTLSAKSNASNPEKFALISQPNEVPMLQTWYP